MAPPPATIVHLTTGTMARAWRYAPTKSKKDKRVQRCCLTCGQGGSTLDLKVWPRAQKVESGRRRCVAISGSKLADRTFVRPLSTFHFRGHACSPLPCDPCSCKSARRQVTKKNRPCLGDLGKRKDVGNRVLRSESGFFTGHSRPSQNLSHVGSIRLLQMRGASESVRQLGDGTLIRVMVDSRMIV